MQKVKVYYFLHILKTFRCFQFFAWYCQGWIQDFSKDPPITVWGALCKKCIGMPPLPHLRFPQICPRLKCKRLPVHYNKSSLKKPFWTYFMRFLSICHVVGSTWNDLLHQAKAGSKVKTIKDKAKRIKKINDKYQRNISLCVNEP